MSKVIGITGGIASGKSTVVEIIKDAGYQVIDADKVVHDLQAPGGKLYRALVDAFGIGILKASGELDRPKLSEMIFANRENMEKSSTIQNQIIRDELLKQKNDLAKVEKVFFMDIPLLIELRYEDWFDVIWLVYVDRDTQVKRLMSRNDYNEEEAEKRLASQMALEDKKARAHVIIDNNENIETLKEQVQTLLAELR